MTLETAMIKAIRQFNGEHKGAEIRTCAVWEMSGHGKNVDYALFHIEYVDEPGAEYYSTDVSVYKEIR